MFVIFHLFHFLPNLPLSSKSSAEEMEEMSFFHFLPPVRKKVISSGRNSTLGGGGGHASLQQIYGLSILPLCDFYWLISTLNIAICDASLLLSPSIFTADVYQVLETCSDMPV